VLLQLLDMWEVRLPAGQLGGLVCELPAVGKHVAALQAPELESRVDSTAVMQAELVSDPQLLLPLVLAGAIPRLLANEATARANSNSLLQRQSIAALALLADSFNGATEMAAHGAVDRFLGAIADSTSPSFLFQALRLLEVLAQLPVSAEHICNSGGLETLVMLVKTYAHRNALCSLCLPALGALKYLLLCSPAACSGAQLQLLRGLKPVATDRKLVDALSTLLAMAAMRESFACNVPESPRHQLSRFTSTPILALGAEFARAGGFTSDSDFGSTDQMVERPRSRSKTWHEMTTNTI
jgi:hypothetical protein